MLSLAMVFSGAGLFYFVDGYMYQVFAMLMPNTPRAIT